MSFPFKLVDLTHTMRPEMPSWNGGCGFSHEVKLDYADRSGPVGFRVQQLKLHAGIGTHIDAPAHCIPGAKTVDQISLDRLLAPCVVIDVSAQCHADLIVQPEALLAFEAAYHKIKPGSCVLFHTGWERHWNTPEQYRNDLVFPALSEEVAHLLLERRVAGLGIDTMSPDRPSEGTFPVHKLLLGNNKYILENVAQASSLPATGAYCLALPLKGSDCTEAPTRTVGLVPLSKISGY